MVNPTELGNLPRRRDFHIPVGDLYRWRLLQYSKNSPSFRAPHGCCKIFHHYFTINSRGIRSPAANASGASVFSVSSVVFQFALEQPLSNHGEARLSERAFLLA